MLLAGGYYSLSGTVSGNVFSGVTVQLIYPDSNYVTQTSDNYGNFIFNQLASGNYILNTSYRGFASDSKAINITGNTNIGLIKLKLLWGNSYDTWGSFANLVPII